jgi:orotate phosphoribosyltransferase
MSSHSSPANKLDARVKAFRKLLELSFKRGKFVLASGKESEFYLDLKPTMFNPEGASLLAQLVLDRIKDLPVDYIGGLELGAVPIVTTVAMLSADTPRPIPGFFVRKAVKDHGTKRLVEAVTDLTGKNVVILEDVTTTGGSAMQAITAARAAGANVILVLSIVDRGEGALAFFQQQGIAFQWLFQMQDFIAATA